MHFTNYCNHLLPSMLPVLHWYLFSPIPFLLKKYYLHLFMRSLAPSLPIYPSSNLCIASYISMLMKLKSYPLVCPIPPLQLPLFPSYSQPSTLIPIMRVADETTQKMAPYLHLQLTTTQRVTKCFRLWGYIACFCKHCFELAW